VHARYRTLFFPGATIVHDHGRDSYKTARALWIHIVNLVKYFNKWGWIYDPERSRVNRKTLAQLKPALLTTSSVEATAEAKPQSP
jgi:hypothetical protein